WVRPDLAIPENDSWALDVRIRYRQPYQKAMLYRKPEGMYIVFDEPQRGIAAGQFAAWYKNGELLGSGVID
ncbi:MAG: aminomethyltransferase beta-barrel domain-containing protein, partial [Bacteroidota bacterium]